MPRRTFWLVAGAAIGAGSSLWMERKVRRTVTEATARFQPDALVLEVGRSARRVAGSAGDRVRVALSSGRDEMLRREQELWADLATRDPAVAAVPPEPHAARRGPERTRPRTRLPSRARGGIASHPST